MHIVGGDNAAFLVDGNNFDKEATLKKRTTKRGKIEPGAWRIEISPENDRADAVFLIVMLPTNRSSLPTHQIRLMEEAGRIGCEITGPKRTTRWWFSPGHKGFDVEIISPSRSSTIYPVWPEKTSRVQIND
jgi:hypothetical protein